MISRNLILTALGLSLIANAVIAWTLVKNPVPNVTSLNAESISRKSVSSEIRGDRLRHVSLAWLSAARLSDLITQLRDLEVDPAVIRAIVFARVRANHGSELNALSEADQAWWRPAGGNSPEKRARNARRSQIEEAIRIEALTALGEPIQRPPHRDVRWNFLSEEKIAAAEEIEKIYADLNSNNPKFQGMNREEIAAIAAEKQKDLAEVLTPQEYAEYQMRFSRTADQMRPYAARVDMTEEEYRALFPFLLNYDVQRETISQAPPMLRSNERLSRSSEASRQAQLEIVNRLGPQRAAEFLWGNDRDYTKLQTAARQSNLSSTIAHEILSLRSISGFDAQAIGANTALTGPEKQAALTQLAADTRTKLNQLWPNAEAQIDSSFFEWLNGMSAGRIRIHDPIGRSLSSNSLDLRPPRDPNAPGRP